MTYSLRFASPSDSNLMCQLMHKAFAIYTHPVSSALQETSESIKKELHTNEQAVLLFTDKNQLVAMVRFKQTLEGIHFHRFCVHPSFQGSGLGSRLLKSLEEYAHSQGIQRLICKVRSNALENINFYEKNGFDEDMNWIPDTKYSTHVLLYVKNVFAQKKAHLHSS